MKTVLLTGFEPFGGDGSNPSGDAVRLVAASWRGPAELITSILPVTFADASTAIRGLIAEHEPDVVIATGLAGNRSSVTPERVAINLIDARTPDNAGERPSDRPVAVGGPAAYFATLPVKAIVRDVRAAGIAADVSFSAGTFVCNQVFYAAMAESSTHRRMRAGFIHVPWSRESRRADAAAPPLADIARALEIAALTSIRSPDDSQLTGGAIS